MKIFFLELLPIMNIGSSILQHWTHFQHQAHLWLLNYFHYHHKMFYEFSEKVLIAKKDTENEVEFFQILISLTWSQALSYLCTHSIGRLKILWCKKLFQGKLYVWEKSRLEIQNLFVESGINKLPKIELTYMLRILQ